MVTSGASSGRGPCCLETAVSDTGSTTHKDCVSKASGKGNKERTVHAFGGVRKRSDKRAEEA